MKNRVKKIDSKRFTKLNIGCGDKLENKFPLPWLNIDVAGEVVDFICDVRKIPTEWTGKFKEVRASHVLEHLYLKEWNRALAEWIRVLKSNGMLRIIVPDLDIVIAVLQKGVDNKGRPSRSLQVTTPAIAQIYGVGYDDPKTEERWRHRIIVDRRSLIEVLTKQGNLEQIEVYDRKDDPAFHYGINDDSQNEFSLCIKAIKTISNPKQRS